MVECEGESAVLGRGWGGESWCGEVITHAMTFASTPVVAFSVVAVLSLTAHEATVTGPEGVKAHWCQHADAKQGLGPACSAVLKAGGADVC